MEPQGENQGTGMPGANVPFPPASEGTNTSGMIIGGIVVLALFAVAYYFMSGREAQVPPPPPQMQEISETTPPPPPAAPVAPAEADAASAALSTQGTSDEVSDIEQDLKSTDLSSFGDVNQI